MADFEVFAEREKAGWRDTEIVEAYVAKFGPITDNVARELISRTPTENKHVLDLCCGQGNVTTLLLQAGARTFGLDFSPEMLALAAKAAPGAVLQQGDAASLPFDDGSFDAVVCNFGMMHLPDQPAALREIRRVLRPGGRFLMATWAAPENSPAFGTVFAAIKAHADFSAAPQQPDLFAFAKPSEAETMMTAAGLQLTNHETVTPAWELSQADELFDIFLTATVAASQLIKTQKPDVITAIRDQITSAVREKFRSGDGYRVPVPIAVLTAKPA